MLKGIIIVAITIAIAAHAMSYVPAIGAQRAARNQIALDIN